MALHALARRALVAGAAVGLLSLAGAGVAQADTTPPPPTFPAVFAGSGTGMTAAAAESAAQTAAMAQQAAFEKASGAMCTDSSSTVKSFMAGDQYAALAYLDAMCTAPMPSGS